MDQNMGTTDRAIRAVVAIGIVGLWLAGVISGMWAIVLGIVAVVFAATSASGHCPAYRPFGLSTRRRSGAG